MLLLVKTRNKKQTLQIDRSIGTEVEFKQRFLSGVRDKFKKFVVLKISDRRLVVGPYSGDGVYFFVVYFDWKVHEV
jgi:hypothetical protein